MALQDVFSTNFFVIIWRVREIMHKVFDTERGAKMERLTSGFQKVFHRIFHARFPQAVGNSVDISAQKCKIWLSDQGFVGIWRILSSAKTVDKYQRAIFKKVFHRRQS